MMILGMNAYHGDVAAVLLRDGEVIAAVEEERFRRVKHWAWFPRESVLACLQIAGIDASNAADAIAAGADGVAVISALSLAADPQAAARTLRASVDAALAQSGRR